MNKESIFRMYFCFPCCYLDFVNKDGDIVTMRHKHKELFCGMPCTKQCALQDWENIRERASKYFEEVLNVKT